MLLAENHIITRSQTPLGSSICDVCAIVLPGCFLFLAISCLLQAFYFCVQPYPLIRYYTAAFTFPIGNTLIFDIGLQRQHRQGVLSVCICGYLCYFVFITHLLCMILHYYYTTILQYYYKCYYHICLCY